jgi:hypothetical protein
MATVQRWGRKEAIIPASAGAGLQTGSVHLCVHCERNIHLYSPSYGLSPVLPPYPYYLRTGTSRRIYVKREPC